MINSDRKQLTPRLLIASLSKPTTLFPSAPEALKPLVQLSRIPCGKTMTNLKLYNAYRTLINLANNRIKDSLFLLVVNVMEVIVTRLGVV